MRKLLAAIAIALSLSACGGVFQVHSTEQVTAASDAKKVQYALDQVNATIAAVAETIVTQTAAGAITKADEKDYTAQVVKFHDDVKLASTTLAGGDITTAAGQAKLLQAGINLLQQKLIAQAAKEGTK